MQIGAFFDRLAGDKTRTHTAIVLPKPQLAPVKEAGGYFQIRVADMSLVLGREWLKQVEPATFILADYNYGGKAIRHPFFVSNAMITGMPPGLVAETLRIRLRDTLVVGPAPYGGGDVALFVGLFKSVIADRRKEAFAIFQKLFGSVDIAGFAQYLSIADKLSETVFDCLSGPDIQCVLAERRVMIDNQSAAGSYYYVLLSARNNAKIDTSDLLMHEGGLRRQRNGKMTEPDELDFCVLSIERMAERDDYTVFPFHALWQQARAKVALGQPAEAQAMMLQCAAQIYESADLSEEHKVGLIEFYQAGLLAARNAAAFRAGMVAAPSRSGQLALVRQLQAQAIAATPGIDRKKLERHVLRIDALTGQFPDDAADGSGAAMEAQIRQHLASVPAAPGHGGESGFLVHALAAASIGI